MRDIQNKTIIDLRKHLLYTFMVNPLQRETIKVFSDQVNWADQVKWADQVNYTVKKGWKALHFTMRILKKGNSNTKSLAYISLVRPILEYGRLAGILTGRDR
jgi:hypothetical protein